MKLKIQFKLKKQPICTLQKGIIPHRRDLIVPSEECQKHHSEKLEPVSVAKTK